VADNAIELHPVINITFNAHAAIPQRSARH
jgi:hypothetical protein